MPPGKASIPSHHKFPLLSFSFKSEYEIKYKGIMNSFFERGLVKRENGNLFTTVKP